MADAAVQAAHKQHGLGQDVVKLHGVVPSATGHAKHRQAQLLHRLLPARLPPRVAGRGIGAHGAFSRVGQAPALTDGRQFGQDVALAVVARRVRGGADVQAEAAAAGHHVDGAAGHFQHAHRGHHIRHLGGALLGEQDQLGHSGGRVAPPVHRRGAGVAGHALHLTQVAHAAIDGGDHPQGQVDPIEHRALFDMNLHEAKVLVGPALELGDVVHTQTSLLHGLAHGDALGVGLVQPAHVEAAGQRTRGQEGGLVALALLLAEGHHLNAEGKPLALRLQFAHTDHGHQDAQTAVVLPTVAHRVEVRSRQQPPGGRVCAALRPGGRAVVHAHHIAHRIDFHAVEAAIGLHPVQQALGAGAVGVGQVGDGQLTSLSVGGLAVLGQLLGPVPHGVAQHGFMPELVVQANLGNAVGVAQALCAFEIRVVVKTPREGGDDLGP